MRSRHQASSIPEVNLIPMLNVLLGVLAFFVIITLTLSKPQGVTVVLPADAEATPPEDLLETEEEDEEPIPPMMIRLLDSGQIAIDDEPIPEGEVEPMVQEHLAQGDEALVFLLADATIPYEKVMDFILDMKRLGGDQVSLALEENS
ncbi:MAG: biopolymer transporter ExbD [Cyanothece sp. SIO2G6]|nr:biopolymer transporter ExbD [Cyanothece sp. SIO2G6]